MKSKLLYILAILAFGVVFNACKDKKTPEPSEEDKQKTLLAKTWVLPSPAPSLTVSVQGNDVTTDWSGFELTFTNDGYSTTGVPTDYAQVWPSSGSWTFFVDSEGNTDVNTLVRNDGVEINVNVNENNLTMGFNYTVGGRLESIEGDWVFKDLVVK